MPRQKRDKQKVFLLEKIFLVFKSNGENDRLHQTGMPDLITLKCDPDYALELRDHYPGVEGAYHFNKKYWNQVSLKGDIDDKMILHLIDHSYEEVIKKFTRKLKQEYNELPD